MTRLRRTPRARRATVRARITRRGWTVVGAAGALVVAGRVFAAAECTAVGIAGILVVAVSVARVAFGRPPTQVLRRPEPRHPHVGDAARIDLLVTPSTRRGTAGYLLTEAVDGGRLQARFEVPSLRSGTAVRRAYRLPTERRGPAPVGPATATRSDAFGFAGGKRVVAEADTVLVRPRVFPIAAPTLGMGLHATSDDSDHNRARSPDAAGDFLSVRPYEVGDDPRRVHWAASARADDLMIRQDVAPRPGRTLVVLDTRAARPAPSAPSAPSAGRTGIDNETSDAPDVETTDEPFERAVEAAASVVTALQRVARPVECRTADGTPLTLTANDRSHRVLDRLALVTRTDADLLAALTTEPGHRAPELVVLVTAGHDHVTRAAIARFARRSATIAVVTGDRPGAPPDPLAAHRSGRTARAVVVDARREPFPTAWERATGLRGKGAAGAVTGSRA
ncbi:MAG: DUF58 domain-containing protein [Actinomycetes bacterium]